MTRIAVTGGIGCGKSLVGSMLQDEGLEVCEADGLAHQVMVPGNEVYRKVVEVFGRDILCRDGQIDRQKLGARVFSHPDELKALNSLVHPAVKKAWLAWMEKREHEGCKIAAVIVPLLYEAGEGRGWDAVMCVNSSGRSQVERLKARGLTEGEIRRRIAAQMPSEEKVKLSDYVVINEGPAEFTKQQVRRIVGHIRES
jgi:dephospho-CoA kinase